MTLVMVIAAVIAGTLVWALIAPQSFWHYGSRFGVPFLVTAAWMFLAISAETDATGYSWMAVGFAIVIVLWFLFRIAISRAAMSRALAIGDHGRLRQFADKRLRAGRSGRALVYRALARDMQGDWSGVLADLADAKPAALDPARRFLADGARIAALVETHDPAGARAAFAVMSRPEQVPGSLPSPAKLLHVLAEARVLWAEGKLDDAQPPLQRVIDDIRTGAYTRAVAHVYAARIADTRGDRATAARDRAAAAKLAPNTWTIRA